MGSLIRIDVDGTSEVLMEDVDSQYVNDNFNRIKNAIKEDMCKVNGTGPCELEFVHVLSCENSIENPHRRLMLVDEIGALDGKEGYPLPVNPIATGIYKNASILRGEGWEGPPYIHGAAYLFFDIVVD